MRDMENHQLKLSKSPNPHTLIFGGSGQGKTYACYRKIEEAWEEDKKILILDYSGSYTKSEMMKSNFKYVDKVLELNPSKNPVYWIGNYSNEGMFISDLADAILSVLGISSYFQKKWMRKAIAYHMEKKQVMNIPLFLNSLERLYLEYTENGGTVEDIDNIKRLLSRLAPYENANDINIKNQEDFKQMRKYITIIQLTGYPELERKFFSNLFITLFWKEVMHRQKKRADLLLLDEFQNLPLSAESAFCSILREGRKYDVELLLSSQFISAYGKAEIESLLQVGNILIFKPTATDLKFSAKIIDSENVKVWQKILQHLKVGEAVLKGHYVINQSSKILTMPIICKI